VVTIAVPAEILALADPKALDQVLVNLIDNAMKYSPAGGRVTVSARRVADDRVRVEVADDGPGIPAVHRDRIFERFYRVDPGRSRDQGGTGLGLSIVKHLDRVDGGIGRRDRETAPPARCSGASSCQRPGSTVTNCRNVVAVLTHWLGTVPADAHRHCVPRRQPSSLLASAGVLQAQGRRGHRGVDGSSTVFLISAAVGRAGQQGHRGRRHGRLVGHRRRLQEVLRR
jgi:hypothetical protein